MPIYFGDKLVSNSSVSTNDITNYKNFIENDDALVIIPDNVTILRQRAFTNNPLKILKLGSGLQKINAWCFECCPNLTSVDFRRCSELTTMSMAFYMCESLESVDLSGCTKMTTLSNSCFKECTALKNIIFPPYIKEIGPSVFNGCRSLSEIIIPSSVTSIGSNCFSHCYNLKTITINKPQDSVSGAPWGAPNATVIWNG